jgi:hypothetical protein
LTSRAFLTNNSSWQTKQSIPPTTVTFYGDYMKMCEYFALNFGNKLHHNNALFHTFFFTREFLTKNNMTLIPPPYFSLFLQLKIKLKCPHFDTIDMIETESQAVLNTLTEHDFQDAFKNCGSAWNCAYAPKVTASRVIVDIGPKVSFCPDGSPSLGNYGIAPCTVYYIDHPGSSPKPESTKKTTPIFKMCLQHRFMVRPRLTEGYSRQKTKL